MLLRSRPRYTCLHLEREGADNLRFQICKFSLFRVINNLDKPAGTRKVKPVWIWEMRGLWDDTGISWTTCKQSARSRRSRQITTLTPHHSIFTGRTLFLTPNQQCQSTECMCSCCCTTNRTHNKSATSERAEDNWYQLEGKYSLESTDPRESEIRTHLRP